MRWGIKKKIERITDTKPSKTIGRRALKADEFFSSTVDELLLKQYIQI